MSDTLTKGIRVTVTAKYDSIQSNPANNKFIFSYHVQIVNEGMETSTLISRHWIITNSFGQTEEVRGVGVVGKTPTLHAGESFEYESYCPLDTEWGTMEGSYQMQQQDGFVFDVEIPKFLLSKNEIIKH